MYENVHVFVHVDDKCWDLKDGERSLRRAKSGENLVEARSDAAAQSVRFSWVLVRTTNRTISQLIPSAVSLRTAAEQIFQVARLIGGIGNMLFSTYSLTKNG